MIREQTQQKYQFINGLDENNKYFFCRKAFVKIVTFPYSESKFKNTFNWSDLMSAKAGQTHFSKSRCRIYIADKRTVKIPLSTMVDRRSECVKCLQVRITRPKSTITRHNQAYGWVINILSSITRCFIHVEGYHDYNSLLIRECFFKNLYSFVIFTSTSKNKNKLL